MVMELLDQPIISSSYAGRPNDSKAQLAVETSEIGVNTDSYISYSNNSNSGINVSRTFWSRYLDCIGAWSDELGQYLRQIFAYVALKIRDFFYPQQFVIYDEAPISQASQQQLQRVARKTLVLDLDETLVHSCYLDPESNNLIGCNFVPQDAVPDLVVRIPILPELQPIEFQVFKRPFVDEFLEFVAKWYDVVIYTASMEAYASTVVDYLDAGRGIFQRRYYRQHCVSTAAFVSKNLVGVNGDLSSVFIIDNSPSAYRDYPQNAIPIKSYIYDPTDEELLNLLPFLDALRFTKDVRSILGRRLLRTNPSSTRLPMTNNR